jgi:phosphate uptake regulator
MMDQRLASKLNLSNIDILDYRIAANLLESAGDYIVDLGTGKDVATTRTIDRLLEAGSLVSQMQEKSVAAFVTRNRSDSITVVKMYDSFTEIVNSIKEMSAGAQRHQTESAIAVLNAAYSLDKIAKCWVDVADLVKPVHLMAPLQKG